jgi:hypothetical protein
LKDFNEPLVDDMDKDLNDNDIDGNLVNETWGDEEGGQ